MANNGYKQATIAYKTDTKGNAVDINGQLVSVSGRRQAIALLEGRANPQPSLYEVELYFKEGALIAGNPTITYDAESCPFGYITVTPLTTILSPDKKSAIIHLESSTGWVVQSSPNFITLDIYGGGAGAYDIKVSASEQGQGEIVFISTNTGLTAKVWVAYLTSNEWVLLNGTWNNYGVWYNIGIWNF